MKHAIALLAAAGLALTASAVRAEDIPQAASHYSQTRFFLEALKSTGMEATLKGKGPYTLFVPSNSAFFKKGKAYWTALQTDKAALTALIKRHIVPGKYTTADLGKLPHNSKLKALGGPLTVTTKGMMKVEGARTTLENLPASNGIFHITDTVFWPR